MVSGGINLELYDQARLDLGIGHRALVTKPRPQSG